MALSGNGRGAAWHGRGRHGRGTAWARHGVCELALKVHYRNGLYNEGVLGSRSQIFNGNYIRFNLEVVRAITDTLVDEDV
jgi:hypothetical protein